MVFFHAVGRLPFSKSCRGGGSSWSAGIHRVAWAFLHTPGTTSVPRNKSGEATEIMCGPVCMYYVDIYIYINVYMIYMYIDIILLICIYSIYIWFSYLMYIYLYMYMYFYICIYVHICMLYHIHDISWHHSARHPQTLDTRQLAKKHLGEIHPRCFTEHSTADSFLINFLGNMIPKAFGFNMIPGISYKLKWETNNHKTKTHPETSRYRKVRPHLGHEESMKAYEQTTSETCGTSKQHIHRKPLQTHTKNSVS